MGKDEKKLKLRSRWVFTGRLKFVTAVAIAGDNSLSATDTPVLRDKRTNKFLLPGSTVAGALRNCLHERNNGYFSSNKDNVTKELFGYSKDTESIISNIIFYDCLSENSYTEVRDGIEIGKNGITVDTAKYDYEVIPANTEFNFRVDLLIPENKNEEGLLRPFMAILNDLENQKIRFGIKRTRGLGQCKVVNWNFKRYNLASREGWDKWLASPVYMPFSNNSEHYKNILEAVKTKTNFLQNTDKPLEDKRTKAELKLDLEIENTFIIRANGQGQNAPDSVSLSSNGKPIVSGTSIAGCLRSRALYILEKVGLSENDANDRVEKIFGPSAASLRNKNTKAKASPIMVNECVIENSSPVHITRVKIDRFTGGALDTALFDEQVQYGGKFSLNIELRDKQKQIEKENIGLLLLLAKDLITGFLPIGAESSVGRGFLKGTSLVLNVFENGENETFTWNKNEKPTEECHNKFNSYVSSFIESCEVN